MLLESGFFENQLFLLHSSQKVVINVRVAKSKTEMKQKHKKINQDFVDLLDISGYKLQSKYISLVGLRFCDKIQRANLKNDQFLYVSKDYTGLVHMREKKYRVNKHSLNGEPFL